MTSPTLPQTLRRAGALLGGLALTATGLTVATSTGPVGGSPAVAASGLTTRAYFNNPYASGANDTRDLVIHRFQHAPKGAVVRMVTFNITDTAISDAMIKAHGRGVQVRVIMAKANCKATAAKALKAALGGNVAATSYLKCVKGSARTSGGTVHQKSITFSKTSGTKYVTLVGSANQTTEGYADQWVDLFQYANRYDVYSVYNAVFRQQKADQDLAQPYVDKSYNGGQGRSQFFPLAPGQRDAAHDPVNTRLAYEIPPGPGTTIQVASYAMHGARGNWLATALINQKAAGSKVKVMLGQPAGEDVIQRLKDARIPVLRAYDPGCPNDPDASSCNYIHLKLMTATYVSGGVQTYRVWTGSDNWADAAMGSDEVNQMVSGKPAWDQYSGFLRSIRQHYKG